MPRPPPDDEGTPFGRRAEARLAHQTKPLVRSRSPELAAAGVERVGRVVGVVGGLPVLEDGRALEVRNVVWCTGFRSDFGWIELPAFEPDGTPRHERGIATGVPGLYFVGLQFQYAESSDTLIGVGRDAAWVAKQLVERAASREPEGAALAPH